MNEQEFSRYIYLVEHDVSRELKEKGVKVMREERLPCRAFKRDCVVVVTPAAWEGICKRKLCWYAKSSSAGKYFIVSPKSLTHFSHGYNISTSPFSPRSIPDAKNVKEMTKDLDYLVKKPPEFDEWMSWEKPWYEKQGVDVDNIKLWHNANHANFIKPSLYIKEAGEIKPYSIAGSDKVCSACLELFGILGEKFRTKYIMPCLGSVQFANLPKDKYLRVEKID